MEPIRRALTALLVSLALFAAPLAAEGQQPGKAGRIGMLATHSPEGSYLYPLRDGLRELGYVEGQNVVIEWRWTRGQDERLPRLAAELVHGKVDVIVAQNNAAIAAAQRATRTVPIVMVIANEPVALAFVASLARPGGNTTGRIPHSR